MNLILKNCLKVEFAEEALKKENAFVINKF